MENEAKQQIRSKSKAKQIQVERKITAHKHNAARGKYCSCEKCHQNIVI